LKGLGIFVYISSESAIITKKEAEMTMLLVFMQLLMIVLIFDVSFNIRRMNKKLSEKK
jgi:hypothetical protein